MNPNFMNMMQMLTAFNQFRSTFRGNPQEQLDALVSSGKVPQDVLNRAHEMARPLYKALTGADCPTGGNR